jgi:hypothetical protein
MPTCEHQASHGIPTATPGQTDTFTLQKKIIVIIIIIINKELKRNMQQRGAVSTLEKGVESRS